MAAGMAARASLLRLCLVLLSVPSVLAIPGANSRRQNGDAGTRIFYPDLSVASSGGFSMLPTPFNLTSASFDVGIGPSPAGTTSFWSSSLLHASNEHDYLVLSHTALVPSGPYTIYRASILDITAKQYGMFWDFVFAAENLYTPSGVLNASYNGSYFYGAPPGNSSSGALTQLLTWSTVPGVEFDLTFDLASKPLLNAGIGEFQVGDATGYEFAFPAAKTTGSLTVNGTKVTVDPTRSLTWYDRQWGVAPPHWTWFEVHLPNVKNPAADGDGTKMSVWSWVDPINGNKTFATVLDGDVQKVMPVNSFQVGNRTFHSAATGRTYALDWDVVLGDGTTLHLSSILPDQELRTADNMFSTYTGYVTIEAKLAGCTEVEGFGVVEIFLGA